MNTRRLYERLATWIHTHRPLRWVEDIATDYSAWTPW